MKMFMHVVCCITDAEICLTCLILHIFYEVISRYPCMYCRCQLNNICLHNMLFNVSNEYRLDKCYFGDNCHFMANLDLYFLPQ